MFDPLTTAILDNGLTLPQVQRALFIILVKKCMARNGNRLALTAETLDVGVKTIRRLLSDPRAGIGRGRGQSRAMKLANPQKLLERLHL